MNLRSWITDVICAISTMDKDALIRYIKKPYKKALHQVNRFTRPGTQIYNQDWDLLIIVDACRYDLFQEVAEEFGFRDVSRSRSVASVTRRWMQLNFTPQYRNEMARTAYICGNPHSDSELDPSNFALLDEVWRDAWVSPGTVPPEAVTNAAIRVGRESSPERMIVHYMQPHCPFIPSPELSNGKSLSRFGQQSWDDVWQRLEKGEVQLKTVWDGYRENLRLALEEVKVLLQNTDANVAVISSDHGNAVGEQGLYGHPERMPFRCLRTVPYVETVAEDTLSRIDIDSDYQNENKLTVNQRLRSLGYI